ncbi:hypothetical protein [Burkholderia latens]|uniref:hypothetical protein n=1 Tax=Burkholderia latens TaxID=488446 RepID=UPI00158BF87D|nr:hypothetical protein [Burkholderia latens]
MNTHAIVAAAVAAASLSAFAQPNASSSGFSAPSPREHAAQAVHRSSAGFALAKIDQNNTPPDRGGDPGGRAHAGTHM